MKTLVVNGIKCLIKHKELTFHSLRNYSFDIYKQALERALFPNYDNFHNPDIAYNSFINRLNCMVNFIAPFKTVRVKNNTSDWFDGEIANYICMISYTKDLSQQNYMLMKKSIRKHET